MEATDVEDCPKPESTTAAATDESKPESALAEVNEAKKAAAKERADRIAAITNRLTQPLRKPMAPQILAKHA